jgi:WD40 repeat protein
MSNIENREVAGKGYFNQINLKLKAQFKGQHTGLGDELTSLNFHHKAPLALVSSDDAGLYLFNVVSGKQMNAFFGHSESISCSNFSPDGRFAISTSEDCTLKKWSILKNTCIGTLNDYKFHSEPVHCMSFQPSKELVVTGGDDGTICISGINTMETYFKSNFLGSPVQAVAVQDKMDVALIGCISGKLELFSLTNRTRLKEFQAKGPITVCKFLPQIPAFIWLDALGHIGRLGLGDSEGFRNWELGVEGEAHDFFYVGKNQVLMAIEAGVVLLFDFVDALKIKN